MLYLRNEPFLAGVVYHTSFAGSSLPPLEITEQLVNNPFFGAVEGNWTLAEEELRKAFETAGVECIYCIGGLMRKEGINPHDFDPERRERSLGLMERMIDRAYAYGAKQVVLCSGPDVERGQRETAKEIMAESFGRLCSYAVEHATGEPLWLCLENFDRELDQKRLLGPTDETVAFVEEVARDHFNIGITLDLSHVIQLGEDPRAAVRAAARHLIHVHIANCGLDPSYPSVFGDSHARFGAPGGAVTMSDLVAFLDEVSRQGYLRAKTPTRLPVISFEIKPTAHEDPWGLVANGQRALLEAVEGINHGRLDYNLPGSKENER